jgi:hypothetical protein
MTIAKVKSTGNEAYVWIDANTNDDAGLSLGSGGTANWQLLKPAGTADLTLYDYGGTAGERVRFQSSSGNVGINSSAPRARLDVSGGDIMVNMGQSFSFGDSGSAGIAGRGNNGGDDYLEFVTDFATRMQINDSGNVGINTSSPRARLDVAGAAYFIGGNIGIGTSVPQKLLEVRNGSIQGTEATSSASAGTFTINWDSGNQQVITLSQTGHTVNFSNYKVGGFLRLIVCQDGTGGRTVTTWDSSILWSGGSAPTLTSGTNKCDVISFVCTNATGSVKTFGSAVQDFN